MIYVNRYLNTEMINYTTFHLYSMKETMLARFQTPLEKSFYGLFCENERKIHEGGCMKDFFCKFPGWILRALLPANFFTDNFQGF